MLQSDLRPADFAVEIRCRRILERHRGLIHVQKDHIAVGKLSLIVEAILDLSNRQGFHATSLRDLVQQSGVSMGGLYSYFDSKDRLLLMILGEVTATVTEVLQSPPAEIINDPKIHLAWLIETHIRLTEYMQKWFVFAFMEAKSFPRTARNIATDSEAATEKLFADVLKRGQETSDFVLDEPDFTASLIKPLLQDWYVKRGKYRKRGVSIETYIDGVLGFVMRSIYSKG